MVPVIVLIPVAIFIFGVGLMCGVKLHVWTLKQRLEGIARIEDIDYGDKRNVLRNI